MLNGYSPSGPSPGYPFVLSNSRVARGPVSCGICWVEGEVGSLTLCLGILSVSVAFVRGFAGVSEAVCAYVLFRGVFCVSAVSLDVMWRV